MTSEPTAIRRIAHLIVSAVLLLSNLVLLGVIFAYRDTAIRIGSAVALAVVSLATVLVVVRPILRWWANPGSEPRAAGPLGRGVMQGALAIVRKIGRRCSPVRAHLLYDTGSVLFERCRYEEAAAKLKEAAALFGEMEDTLNQALALQELGNAQNAASHHDEAVLALEQALALWEHLAANQRQDNTWRLLNNLAVALSDKGSLGEAERYCRRALHTCREEIETAMCRVNLADIHRQQRRYAEAEETLSQALEVLDRKRDENLPFAVTVLAMLHDDRGHWKEAEDLYSRAMELLQQQYPTGHPEVLRVAELQRAMLVRSGKSARPSSFTTIETRDECPKSSPP